MAATFTLQTSSYDGRYLKLTCTQVQKIQDNQSEIQWKLESIGGSVNYYATGPTKVWINGELVFTRARLSNDFPAIKGSVSGYTFVNHNADGKKTISVTLQTGIYTSAVGSYGGSWILDAIPRAASLNSATNFTDEENPTITYTNSAGNNASALQAYIYASDYSTVLVGAKNLNKTGASYTYSLTAAERQTLRKATKTNTLKVYFVIKTTINGATYNSNWVEKTMTIVNANPTVLSAEVVDINETTFALTDDTSRIVKGVSTAQYNIIANANKDATITSYAVTCGSAKSTGASGSFTNAQSNVFEYTVTDSRGNTTTGKITKTLVNYVKPTCNQSIKIELTGETEAKATVSVNGNYFNGSFGAVANTLTLQYRIATNDGSYSSWKAISATPTYRSNTYSLSYTITGLTYTNSYKIQTRAKDKLNTKNSSVYVAKLQPVFDWSNTDFSFNVPVSIEGNALNDFVIETGTASMGSNGTWYWRKWKSGRAECYGRRNYGNMGVSTTWGALYMSDTFEQALPDGLFTATPESIEINTSAGAFIIGTSTIDPSKSSTGGFRVARGESATLSQVKIGFNVIGRWK